MKFLYTSILMLCTSAIFGQESKDFVHQTFRDTRIINGQSVETQPKGEMKFIIGHRFGEVNGGGYEFFGLDNSTIRLGFDYGITDNITIGIGRSSFQKTFDGFGKVRFLRQQTKGMPVTMTWQSAISLNSLQWADPERDNYFTSRLFYTHQLMVARKFNDRFSAQLMPTVVHRNLIDSTQYSHDVISIGASGKYQVSKMISFTAEYYYNLPDQMPEAFNNCLSLGIDIDTKGHVFQFSFSNSRGMTEKFFVTNTQGDWLDGSIYFGFNITRDFKVRGRKY